MRIRSDGRQFAAVGPRPGQREQPVGLRNPTGYFSKKGMKTMERTRKIKRVLLAILVINYVVAAVKIALGYVFAFGSLLSDGYHALSDGTANIAGLIGNRFASRDPDKRHPYGYHKYETLSALFIGLLLFGIAGIVVANAVSGFLTPHRPDFDGAGFLGVFITLALNTVIAALEYRAGKRLESEVLISDSLHTRGDVLISLGVLTSAALIRAGLPPVIDSFLSLFIAGLVFALSVKILRITLPVLLDKNVLDEREVIAMICELDDAILEIHKFRSRGKQNHIYIDFHLVTHGQMTITESHLLSHRIEEELRQKLGKTVEVIAHIEPQDEMLAAPPAIER